MSSTIQHKLLNYQTPPPEGCWQKIAAELDDSASGFLFPSRLKEMAVVPPVHLWNQLSAQLDMTMPAEDIAAKLYTAEAVPPVSAWNRIRTSLDAGLETSMPKKHSLPAILKYAAAVAIIGFIAFGAFRIFDPGQKGTTTISGNTPAEKVPNTIPVATDNDLPEREPDLAASPVNEEEARNDAALEASKKTFARLDVPSKKRVDMASEFHFSQYFSTKDISEHGSSGYAEGLSLEPDNISRYIVLMTPEGHFIRMSKKLSGLLCCVSGEDEDENCKTQIEKWRKQLAGSGASHPGNFMDILNLVGSLRD